MCLQSERTFYGVASVSKRLTEDAETEENQIRNTT